MPQFNTVGMEEAQQRPTSGAQAHIEQEFQSYIDRLRRGQAGKLTPEAGETATAMRRRLGAAARASGAKLTIRRAGDDVYFWVESRRRGRRTR